MRLMLVAPDDRFFLKVAQRLVTQNVNLAYLIVEGSRREDFKGTQVFDYEALMRYEYFEEANRSSPYVLSEEIIREFKECEDIFLVNSDRLAFFNISVRKRKIIYYEILLYWYTFLKQNRVDRLFFDTTPHLGWDLVLYFVAKKMGVETLYLERTGINDLVLLVGDYVNMDKVPLDFLSEKSREEVIETLGEEFYQRVQEDSYWVKAPRDFPPEGERFRKYGRRFRNTLSLMKELLSVSGYRRFDTPTVFFLNYPLRRNSLIMIEQLRKLRDLRNRRYYTKWARDPEYDKDYVFFPLQFQPERTSIPLGGIFENQLLALKILSKSIPQGWKIYVKEHPRQLKRPRINSAHYRNPDYYDRMRSIPNVEFIHFEENTKQLIEHAHLTATLTGSAGWESLMVGKACMVFGHPWYAGCRSCFRVDSLQTCQEAISQIVHKSKQEVELDVLKFLAYYRERFIVSSNSDHFANESKRSYDLLVNNLAEAIVQHVKGEPAKDYEYTEADRT